MSDRGLGPPKDYPDPLEPNPFDPEPFAGLKRQVWVRVYLVLAVFFLLALVVMCDSDDRDLEASPAYAPTVPS